jgi:hypothetical protein
MPQVTYPCVCALSIINHVHSLQRNPFPRFQRSLSPCVNMFRPAGSPGRSEGGTAGNSAKRGWLDSSGQLSAPTEIYSTMPWRFGTGTAAVMLVMASWTGKGGKAVVISRRKMSPLFQSFISSHYTR